MNPLKDTKQQSSLQFFNARVKNQYEDLKLQREIQLLDRRIGMTNAEFKREVQALRKELGNMKKSSGRSEEGRENDGESSHGEIGKRSPGNSRGKKLNKRAKSAGPRIIPRTDKSALARLKRPKSSPGAYRNGQHATDTVSETMVELPVTKTRLNAKTCSNLAWRKGHNNLDPPVSDAARIKQSAWCHFSGRWRPHTVDPVRLRTEKLNQARNKETTVTVEPSVPTTKRTQSTTSEPSDKEKKTVTSSNKTLPSPSESSFRPPNSAKQNNLRSALKATPLSNCPSTDSDSEAKTRWLKSALKTRRNERREKRVTIMENGQIYGNAEVPDSTFHAHEKSEAETNRPENSARTEGSSSLGLLSLLMSGEVQTGTPPSPTPNVIPDVRKKPKQTVEDVSMKERRDSLLKASIVSLMSGGRNRRKALADAEAITQEEDESKLSTAKKSSRRLSFRTMGKVMMSKRYLTIQQRTTLGVRLKVHPVLKSAMTNKSIKANLSINDDESDSGNEAVTSLTPKTDASVSSKIIKSWRQDSELDKPPVLEDDLKQLQKHLAASHLSRERELERLQMQQEVNHLMVIDEDRRQRVMSKVRLFISILEDYRRRDRQEQRRLDVFGGPSRNPVVQRWKDAAKGLIRKR